MKTMTKDHPILFRSELVRAILEGRKTQTRRIIRPEWWRCLDPEDAIDRVQALPQCPYGQRGTHLWVRETWRPYEDPKTCIDGVLFRADGSFREIENTKEAADKWLDARGDKSTPNWRPSIFMPRWACRLKLEIVKVRIERLQEITEKDARAEGIEERVVQVGKHSNPTPIYPAFSEREGGFHSARAAFEFGWDSINAPRGFGWDANPWLWVLDFKRVK